MQPAIRAILGNANPKIAIMRTEGSLEQARFIMLAQDKPTNAALGKEFGISPVSAWNIELKNAGKIKRAAKRNHQTVALLSVEGSLEQARFIKLAQGGGHQGSACELAKEFDTSAMSASTIRTELSNAGKLKLTRTFKQGQSQGGHTKLKVSSS